MKKDADGNGYAWIPVKIAELAIERITADATLVQATAALHEDMIQTLKSELAQLRFNNANLKAEVERLTKAGDAMASSIQFNEKMAQDYNGPAIVHQSVQRWQAAKEGKQS